MVLDIFSTFSFFYCHFSVDQHGSILWPYNVAQCIACLVLSPDQYLQNVATERTIVRCEELALKHRGWKVITVRIYVYM